MVYVITRQERLIPSENWKYSTMEELLIFLEDLEEINFDTETTGFNPYIDKLLSLQFGNGIDEYFVDCTTIDISPLKPVMENRVIVGQNLKFDLKFMYRQNIIPRKIYDTMVAENVLYCGVKTHRASLDILVERYCGEQMDKTIRKNIGKLGMTDEVIEYSVKDVRYLPEIKRKQLEEAKIKGLTSVIHMENRFTPALAYIEYCGINLDRDKWKAKMEKDDKRLIQAEEKLNEFLIKDTGTKYLTKQLDLFSPTTCSVMWSSSQQVITVFEELGINCTTFEKGKLKKSVEANVIKKQATQFPIIAFYLEYQKARKIVSTYGQSFLDKIDPVSTRLHTSFKQIMNTGRTSSGEKNKITGEERPNFQNIPNDSETRGCFTATPGNVLIVADYSGQEQILLANNSMDKNLLDFYDKGLKDMHCFVAQKMYPELETLTVAEIKEYHPEKRQAAKTTGFAVNYGGVGATIAEQMGIPTEEGDKIYNAYFSGFPGLKDYFKRVHTQALRDGFILISKVTGRKSYIWKYPRFKELESQIDWEEYRIEKSRNSDRFFELKEMVREYFNIKGKIERDAQNFPIQGQAAEVTKISCCYIFDWIVENGQFGKVLFVNTVHDENVIESPEEISKDVSKMVEDAMCKAGLFYCKRVPLVAVPKISGQWTK